MWLAREKTLFSSIDKGFTNLPILRGLEASSPDEGQHVMVINT